MAQVLPSLVSFERTCFSILQCSKQKTCCGASGLLARQPPIPRIYLLLVRRIRGTLNSMPVCPAGAKNPATDSVFDKDAHPTTSVRRKGIYAGSLAGYQVGFTMLCPCPSAAKEAGD